MVNKVRLYWSLQVGGWALYAVVQIVFAVLAGGEGNISNQRILFLLYEATLCLIVSHMYRNRINRWKWLSLGMSRLFPRAILSVLVMGCILYFVRIPAAVPLGFFNKSVVLE